MLSEAGVDDVSFTHAGSGEEAAIAYAGLRYGVGCWRGKQVLFLIRDPRDVVVSYYFQATRRSRDYSGTFHEFLRDPRFGIERIIQFNLLWLDQRHQFTAFNVLSYEDLHADPKACLRSAALFLTGRHLAEEQLRRVVRRCTFDALRQMELSGEGRRRWGVRLSPGECGDPESFKVRRGLVGGWSDYFDEVATAHANALLRKHDYFARVESIRLELAQTAECFSHGRAALDAASQGIAGVTTAAGFPVS